MKILAVGDLVGENGVKYLDFVLPRIQEDNDIDFTIANVENSAGGSGISTKIYNNLNKLNIDAYTLGNHTWGKKDIFSFIDDPKVIRPANYSDGVPGHGYTVFEKNGKKIAVVNLIGRTDMNVQSENPFLYMDELLKEIKADYIIIDFHAEATAEKLALAYYLDGRVNVVFGTHTHVQSADERILDKGTGYITDIGMTGPYNSVIGMDKEAALKRFLTSIPERYKLADGKCMINAVVFDINDKTGKVEDIYRISEKD